MVWHVAVAPTLDWGLPYQQRLHFLVTTLLLGGWYLHGPVASVSPGMARLVLAAPVLAMNLLLAFMFSPTDELLTRTSVVFLQGWLGTFKVLAFCLNRGPLRQDLTLPQFIATLILPIIPRPPSTSSKPQGRLQDSGSSPMVLLLRWVVKIIGLGGVVYALVALRPPLIAKHALYCLGMYFFIGVLMDGPASAAVSLIGMELIPTFDQPWLSTSLADWWGRRWNITTSTVLRMLVYDTICDGCLVKRPAPAKDKDTGKGPPRAALPMWRRALATFATFCASAIAHELILWVIQTDGAVGWRWLVFFSMQGPLMLLETLIVPWCKARGISLPSWAAVVLTLGVLELCAAPFFFGAVELDSDTADRVVEACKNNYLALLGQATQQAA